MRYARRRKKHAGGGKRKGRVMEYYTDGVTRVTDGLYVCKCEDGHTYWSLTYQTRCSKCGKKVSCMPASNKKGAR